jgi:hypothetical protein
MGEAPAESAAESRTVREAFTRFVDAFNEGDIERAFAEVTEDFAVILPPGFPERTVSGRDNAINYYRSLWESLNWQVVVQEVRPAGPHRFLVELLGHGAGSNSGLQTDRLFWGLLEVEDGKGRRLHEYADREQALAAAGLRPEPGARA